MKKILSLICSLAIAGTTITTAVACSPKGDKVVNCRDRELTADEQLLIDKIDEYDSIVIAKHVLPDWDALGSAEGLREIIKDNFEPKTIYIVGASLDRNIYELPDTKEVTQSVLEKSLLITVDTANKARIDLENWESAKEIFKVDHHIQPEEEKYGHHNWVDDTAMAAAQMIVLWAYYARFEISKEAATNLYRGILTDSGKFKHDKTDERTFQAASICIKTGVNNEEEWNFVSKKAPELEAWLKWSVRLVKAPGTGSEQSGYKNVAVMKVTKKDTEKFWDEVKEQFPPSSVPLRTLEIKQAVNISQMRNHDMCALYYEDYEDKEIEGSGNYFLKAEFRSKKYDTAKVAKKHGGGGHSKASGATLKRGWDEADEVTAELQEAYDNKEPE